MFLVLSQAEMVLLLIFSDQEMTGNILHGLIFLIDEHLFTAYKSWSSKQFQLKMSCWHQLGVNV